VKTKDLILHPLKIPPSVKALKLILQPLDELRESEGYQALQSDLNCEMELLHRKLVEKYVKPLNLMNSDAYLKRVHLAICALLRNASKAFIAQLNLINYSADEALIDLLASTPKDILTFPLPLDAASFLTLYKEANEDITQLRSHLWTLLSPCLMGKSRRVYTQNPWLCTYISHRLPATLRG
jgi:hypothetical protein